MPPQPQPRQRSKDASTRRSSQRDDEADRQDQQQQRQRRRPSSRQEQQSDTKEASGHRKSTPSRDGRGTPEAQRQHSRRSEHHPRRRPSRSSSPPAGRRSPRAAEPAPRRSKSQSRTDPGRRDDKSVERRSPCTVREEEMARRRSKSQGRDSSRRRRDSELAMSDTRLLASRSSRSMMSPASFEGTARSLSRGKKSPRAQDRDRDATRVRRDDQHRSSQRRPQKSPREERPGHGSSKKSKGFKENKDEESHRHHRRDQSSHRSSSRPRLSSEVEEFLGPNKTPDNKGRRQSYIDEDVGRPRTSTPRSEPRPDKRQSKAADIVDDLLAQADDLLKGAADDVTAPPPTADVSQDDLLNLLDPKAQRKVEKILSRIEHAKERSRSRSGRRLDRRNSSRSTTSGTTSGRSSRGGRSGSDGSHHGGAKVAIVHSDNMKHASSTATLATKSLSSGSCPSLSPEGRPLVVRRCTPPPPPPPRVAGSANRPITVNLVRSTSTGALSKTGTNDADASGGGPRTPNDRASQRKLALSPPPSNDGPPPQRPGVYAKRPSQGDLSSCPSQATRRTNPPPPPPRRTMMSRLSVPDLGRSASSMPFNHNAGRSVSSASVNHNASSPAIGRTDAIVPYDWRAYEEPRHEPPKDESFRPNFLSTRRLLGRRSSVVDCSTPAKDDSPTARPSTAPNGTKHLLSRTNQSNREVKSRAVTKMCYTDPHGDAGLYTGEVDDDARPHGKGKMKYENGVYYEGKWIHGTKDDGLGQKGMDAASSATRERILSGFTSWKGQKKNPKDGAHDRGTFVYGMEWVDLRGLSGKYTGHVNEDDTPDGKGVMRYDFGLVAEGDWIKGVLNDAGGINPTGAMSVAGGGGGMSVAPGMSVSGGAASVVSGLGMMSIGGGIPSAAMMGGYPGMPPNQYYNASMNATQFAPAYYNPMAMAGGASYHAGMMGCYQQPPPVAGGGMVSVPADISAVQKRQ